MRLGDILASLHKWKEEAADYGESTGYVKGYEVGFKEGYRAGELEFKEERGE